MNDLRSSMGGYLNKTYSNKKEVKMWVHYEHENTIRTGLMFKGENCKEFEENSRTSCVF